MQSPALTPDPLTLPLREIHLPESVGWWPPAAGWWLLFGVLLLGFAAAWYGQILYRRRKYSSVSMARRELAGIRARYDADQDTRRCVQAVSALLRRVSISVFPRKKTAGLTGRKWLEFLLSDDKNAALFRPAGEGSSGIRLQGGEPATSGHLPGPEARCVGGLIPQDTGKLLLEAPYRRQITEAEVEALINFCSDWLETVSIHSKSGVHRSKP